jgi:hypothetical protein
LAVKPVGLGGVHVEDAEGAVLSVDDDREAAGGAEGAQYRRHRVAGLALPVVDDRVGSRVQRGAGVRVARGGDPAAAAEDRGVEAGPQVESAAVAAELPDAGAVDAVDLGDQLRRRVHQLLRVAVLHRPLAETGDDRLLGEGALQLQLGLLALADVVEDAVPDRDPVLAGFQDRLVVHPDDLAVTPVHSVFDRRRVAIAEVVLGFQGKGALAILGVQQAGPEAGVADEVLRLVAEDLLDLRTDVAPAAPLSELGGIDDDRQLLDQPLEVVSPRGKLVEEAPDLVLRPVPIGRLAHPSGLSTLWVQA